MKLFNKTTLASLLVIGAMTAGTASAMTKVETTPLFGVVGITSANLTVRVQDGVATLSGVAENGSEAALAKRYVANMDGIEKVISQIIIN